jgi:hypothetical protein
MDHAHLFRFLQEFDFNCVYIPGRPNQAADAHSRSHAVSTAYLP